MCITLLDHLWGVHGNKFMCRCVYSQPLYNPVIYACIKFQKYFVTDMIEYLLPRISVETEYPHTIVVTCETSLPLPLFRYTPIKAWMLMYHFFSYHYPKWIMKFNLILFLWIDNVRFCDEGMVEAVTTLIWAAPRLQSDVQELRVVSPVMSHEWSNIRDHKLFSCVVLYNTDANL